MFFGTPLNDSTTPVKAIFEALGLQSDDAMLDKLGYRGSDIAYCRFNFAEIRHKNKFKVKAFYEMTQHNGTFLVPFQSSILSDPTEDTQALEGDHFQICRFTERSYSWVSIIAKDLQYFHMLAQATRGRSRVTVRGTSGQTALHMAVIRGDVEGVNMLVPQSSIDVNTRDDQDRTPLHEAARYGFVAIASTLIDYEAGIMVKDQNGLTPLHEASQHGHRDMAALLIEAGADYDTSDNHGVTPLLYAVEKGHESIVQLLRRARDKRERTAKVEERLNDGYNDMDDDPDNLRDNSSNPESAANKQSSLWYNIMARNLGHRGKLRLWFSVWRLHYCEVVKFQRLALNHMARDYRDLPTHEDYKYRPKGQDAKNPPISQHMFDVMFNSCDIGCNRMLPHDCFQSPGGVDQLERIPKRVRSFQRDTTVEIWGLSTVHDVSFAYVSFYHCLMVLGPLVFYACWMKAFPQDLQNASVPISLVLGALSMFWSSCGILTSNRMD
ncbi:hypothetical protein PG995_000341 [Apiospora arundinis]